MLNIMRQTRALYHAVTQSSHAIRLQPRLPSCTRGVCMSAQASLNGREDVAQTARDSDGGDVFPETRHPKKRSRRASSKSTSAQEARLKPSKKLRTHSSKTHPSKEREKAWQAQHDRKTKSWQASTTSLEASIIEHPEQYFDEKWVHRQGRLSDFTGSVDDEDDTTSPNTRGRHHRRLRPQAQPVSDLQQVEEAQAPSTSMPFQNENVACRTGWQFFATCHPGLEEPVANELRGPMIRAQDVSPGQSGVTFWGPSIDAGYRACLWLRSAIRVLVLLAAGPIDCTRPSGDVIYEWVREAVDWPELLQRGQTFSVDARLRNCSTIPSSQLARTRIRDAIADSVRDRRGEKLWPPAHDTYADIPLYAALYNNEIKLYRDMSGKSLHRRGYRAAMHAASLNESAAAGLLSLAGWPREGAVLADPMCGSGTFLIEAALLAKRKAPGLDRPSWPFQTWVDQDKRAWKHSLQEAQRTLIRDEPSDLCILGNDIHGGALSLAKRDAAAAGVLGMIDFSRGSCGSWEPAQRPQLIVTNPPWGLRLDNASLDGPRTELETAAADSDSHEASELSVGAWESLGTFLKVQCRDSDAFILTGNTKPPSKLGLRASQKFAVGIGGVDCQFLHYKILPARDW